MTSQRVRDQDEVTVLKQTAIHLSQKKQQPQNKTQRSDTSTESQWQHCFIYVQQTDCRRGLGLSEGWFHSSVTVTAHVCSLWCHTRLKTKQETTGAKAKLSLSLSVSAISFNRSISSMSPCHSDPWSCRNMCLPSFVNFCQCFPKFFSGGQYFKSHKVLRPTWGLWPSLWETVIYGI